jgi:membrane protein DedA with SNARE-associated domain
LFESLTDYVGRSPEIAYPFIFAIAALDVLFPVVPSETSVILAGVFASTGDLVLVAVIAVAAAGAVMGDNASYWIGRSVGHRIVARFLSGERQKRIDWAEEQIQERGPYLIVVGRFIPGGRTAVTVSAGILQMPYGRFLTADVVAGALWASYAALLGYVGGSAFEEEPWKGFLAAFAVALAVTGVIEVVRWARRRRAAARVSA